MAGVLKVAFETEFSEENYTNIKSSNYTEKRPKNSRDHRQSRRGEHGFVDVKGQSRLFVAKGKADHMTPRKLVDYIEKTSNVHGKRIQGVEIYNKYSFVNVSFKDAESIIRAFKASGSNKRPIVELAKEK